MKLLRILLVLGASAVTLLSGGTTLAADSETTSGATVVPQDRDDDRVLRDLSGVPDSVKTLIVTFDQTRDRYLQQQRLLLARLRHAASPQEQDQVRRDLQANRQDFLTQLKGFREELRTDLEALKGKIGHAEFGRIIDAAHRAGTDSGHRHRGQ